MIKLDELMNLSHDLSILYVEDDLHMHEEMYEILEDFFAVVISAKNGEDGFTKFEQYRQETGAYPDIILTDMMMPKSNGIEMSKKILSRNVEQVIIVLSAHNESKYLLELINMGIEHYLVKPVNSVHLLQTFQRAVKKIKYKKMEVHYTRELEKLAYKDPLTGISNRRRFFKRAETLFVKKSLSTAPMYLFMLDIDKFKIINDTFGHDVGDEVIKVLVDIVKKEISSKACFARLGGDEFVLLVQKTEAMATSLLQKIQDQIYQTHLSLESNVRFTVSIGMTEISENDKDIDVALKRADIDLYKNKLLQHTLLQTNL